MRVLIAEDDPISRRVLETMLARWGYETAVASNGREAWEALTQSDAPRLAILDWMMPEMSGVDVCRRVREAEERDYVYIILLTAKGRQEDIIEGLNAGADDYITKPFDSGELRVRLRAAQRIVGLQAELAAVRQALAEKATHDYLTGLWNRPAAIEALDREICRCVREGRPVGLLMIDVDQFGAINDAFGCRAADSLLCEVARRVTDTIRPYDLISRYGGDEFLVVVPGCDVALARGVGERLRRAISDSPVASSEGSNIPVTVSIGVSTHLPGDPGGTAELIQQAESALSLAKQHGGNRIEPRAHVPQPSPGPLPMRPAPASCGD